MTLAAAKFCLAELSLVLLGVGAAFHPSVRPMRPAARMVVAFAAGSVGLTLEASFFSILGIAWTLPGLAIPLLLGSLATIWLGSAERSSATAPVRMARSTGALATAAGAASFLYLVLSLLSSAATSVDFLFFWGVKAVRFAEARGFDALFLQNPFSIHAVPDYPPLVPVVQAWGCLAAGEMPWQAALASSALWAVAPVPLLFGRLRIRLGDGRAAVVVVFWCASLCVSLAYSYSGGNAEAPLLFFETIALAWLLTEEGSPESRFVPVLACCGAALTKVEGFAAVVFLALGSLLKDRGRPLERARASLRLVLGPMLCVSVWFLYQASRSLPVGYRPHGDFFRLFPRHFGVVLAGMLKKLDAGSAWVPWLFAVAWLAMRRRDWKSVAPALTLAVGLLAFLVFDYLHDRDDPTQRIGWTMPRVSQPALSAAVLAAGVVSARPKKRLRAGCTASTAG